MRLTIRVRQREWGDEGAERELNEIAKSSPSSHRGSLFDVCPRSSGVIDIWAVVYLETRSCDKLFYVFGGRIPLTKPSTGWFIDLSWLIVASVKISGNQCVRPAP